LHRNLKSNKNKGKKMNLFWVLAIGLTVLYIIYYAAIIMQDVYGKKDNEQKTESENIEVPESDTSESPTVINETDDDPLFGDESDNDNEITLVENIDDVGEIIRQEALRHSAEDECKRLSSELNEIQVESTGATEKEEFIDMLVNQPAGGRKIFLTRENL